MRSGRRPEGAVPAKPEEPVLLLPPPSARKRSVRRSEPNTAGYQETPLDPSTADANREAADNCALLHRARKESESGAAAAEDSPRRPLETRE